MSSKLPSFSGLTCLQVHDMRIVLSCMPYSSGNKLHWCKLKSLITHNFSLVSRMVKHGPSHFWEGKTGKPGRKTFIDRRCALVCMKVACQHNVHSSRVQQRLHAHPHWLCLLHLEKSGFLKKLDEPPYVEKVSILQKQSPFQQFENASNSDLHSIHHLTYSEWEMLKSVHGGL